MTVFSLQTFIFYVSFHFNSYLKKTENSSLLLLSSNAFFLNILRNYSVLSIQFFFNSILFQFRCSATIVFIPYISVKRYFLCQISSLLDFDKNIMYVNWWQMRAEIIKYSNIFRKFCSYIQKCLKLTLTGASLKFLTFFS